MIVNRPSDVMHKIQLLKLLTAIVDDPVLAKSLYFKGGTCAAMSGFLNRFSVDLDFDYVGGKNDSHIRAHLERIFTDLGLRIDTEGKPMLMYAVKYDAPVNSRNTIHIDALRQVVKSTTYESRKLTEIDRVVVCQTKESMVSHKLLAPFGRWESHHAIAGRDVYDIHQFFMKRIPYSPDVIIERMGLAVPDFFKKLIVFFKKEVTQQLLQEDLNTVLSYDEFRKIRKTLKEETIFLLNSELQRLEK